MPYSNTAAIPRWEIADYLQEAMDANSLSLAERIFPMKGTEKSSGRYPKITKSTGELLKKGGALRAPDGAFPEVTRQFEWATYKTESKGLATGIDDELQLEMEDYWDAEALEAELLMRALLLDYESEAAGVVMNESSWQTTQNSSVDYTEANLATINFPLDIAAARTSLRRLGVMPNTMLMSENVFNRIRRSPILQTHAYGQITVGQSGNSYQIIEDSHLAQIFKFQQVLVATGVIDAGAKGVVSLSDIWPDDYIWIGKVAGGDFKNGGAGRTIVWDEWTGGGMWRVETWRDEEHLKDKIRTHTHRCIEVIDSNCGLLINTDYS